MKHLFFIAMLMIASSLLGYGEKLSNPVKLQETKMHSFGFDKSDLQDNPYFASTATSNVTSFSFDGEWFNIKIDDNILNNRVKSFEKTKNNSDNSWQYLITFEDKDPFPIFVEIDFLADKTVLIKYPMMDTKTGNIYGYNISECTIIK